MFQKQNLIVKHETKEKKKGLDQIEHWPNNTDNRQQ